MKITRIKLLNILGHEEYELKLGEKLTLIKGKNALGKSSIIKALQAAFKGQSVNEATLLRNGAEKGEIVVELDDETTIKKTVGKTGSKNNQSTSLLNKLAHGLGLNPVEFLLMSEKKKLDTVLEIINVHYEKAEIQQCVSDIIDLSDEEDDKVFTLEDLAAIRKQVYEERTVTNRMLKDKQATLQQMVAVVPLGYDEARHIEVKEQIEEKRSKKDLYSEKLEKEKAEEIQAIHDKYAKKKQDMLDSYEQSTRPLLEEQTILENALKQIGAYEEQKKFIDSLSEEIRNYNERTETLTSALDSVDELEKSKLTDLPIKGMTINEGSIYLDGVRFEHVNSARQVSFILSLAALQMGEVKTMLLDGIELLDSVKRKELLNAISKSKIQVILTQVTDDSELTIEYS